MPPVSLHTKTHNVVAHGQQNTPPLSRSSRLLIPTMIRAHVLSVALLSLFFFCATAQGLSARSNSTVNDFDFFLDHVWNACALGDYLSSCYHASHIYRTTKCARA